MQNNFLILTMQNFWKNALIAFVAGLVGAYTYQLIIAKSTPQPSEIAFQEEAIRGTFVKKGESALTTGGDFIQASALSTPSVVFIKTTVNGRENLDLFELYFGGGGRQQSGSGSGVIFTADGYIVTNNHVIDGADKIEVIHQKKSYEAKVIGTDPSADLAIIKIEAKTLPAIKRGSAKDLQVGEWVIAVGNPFNLTSTVTAGIVSAKGRNIDLLGGQFPLESFIQTDAAINPGNSGGALVNAKGELVGINTAILSRTGSYTGYGFAVPIDVVGKIFNDIIQYGEVQKGFSGLTVADIDNKRVEDFNLSIDKYDGVVVLDVQPNSHAEKAGVKAGDIILKMNNNVIAGKSGFDEVMSYYRPGEKLNITYQRGKQTQEAAITLTNREGTTTILKSEQYSSTKLGADLEPLSKVEKEKMGLEDGIRVLKIKRGILANMGMQEGFIITSINKLPVKTAEEIERILSNTTGRIYISGITKNGQRGYYEFYSQR